MPSSLHTTPPVSEKVPDDPHAPSPGAQLANRYQEVRRFSERLCEPLEAEDYVIQSMPDVSPAKWHLAHTSWFFETFLLAPGLPGYRSPHPQYGFLFNSYYNAVGDRHCRAQRGLLSRPTVRETYDYRRHIDEMMMHLLRCSEDAQLASLEPLVTLGLHHEQQHQELILTDLKHVFSVNPLRPAYIKSAPLQASPLPPPMEWVEFDEGIHEIGHTGEGFCFDNETPHHRVFLERYALADRLVTCGEYRAFMEEGSYERPEFWLSAGWATVQERGWKAPLYWERRDGEWQIFTLSGMREIDDAEPVCHVSYYEADAYARWSGARLPTESEWEIAARDTPVRGNFAEDGRFHPMPLGSVPEGPALHQLYGDVWEWTRSPYEPYPGYQPDPGALGEYNGKFMCGQYVLRGGSCATSLTHIRPTYRNFFPPDARWQFSGIRLARQA
ncbi:MAG: ergothioneine biosynthesis protein EgtB [Armatimonadetes bacterium]|nr:ergothioneine biosynthesis protein EgtB [Armatimonadota bacterium]